ncbi:MAG: phosphoglucomutase/phosphomannomutase family protein [Bacteroidetes bacterium]|nr:phosphoglucomutase/phosphomannomutase family protein [Bacteroidota bacterium]
MSHPIKFGTDGWRAIIADTYTLDNLSRVTAATADYVKAHFPQNPSVMIGYDCRFGGPLFARAVANQLAQAGIKAFISPDYASTPMVSLATLQRQCSLGIVITASHNPPEYSGFKLKGHFGGPAFPALISEVESLIPQEPRRVPDHFETLLQSRQIEYYDMEALYINHLKQSFDLNAIRQSGLRIGYDAMFGAGQGAMRKLFPQAHLLHCELNPSFEGTAPEPIEKNLAPFRELIRTQNLDFGLATDGDADRIGLFDEEGNFVDSHHIMLLAQQYLYQDKGLRGKIVYTFSCTDKIRQMAEKHGLPHEQTKIGFKYIGEIMANEQVLVGGEESGGMAVAGHIPERDGIYMGLLMLEMMARRGKTLTQLVQELYAYIGAFSVQRYDLHIDEDKKHRVMLYCQGGKYQQFGAFTVERTEDLDGYKFHLGEGRWVMVRPSGTEPLLRVYAEGHSRQEADAILEAAVAVLSV